MIKSITVVGPHLVDELFHELCIDLNDERNRYILEKFRIYEQERVCGFYVKGFNSGASQQMKHDNPQKLEKVEYIKFMPDFTDIINYKS
jgi:hypothetical protein